jgi:hypothetical protein
MENQENKELVETASIEEILLDVKSGKYKLIPVATRWIAEISKKEEYKYFTFNQLLEAALKDILTGKVSIEEIEKLPPIEKKKHLAAAAETKRAPIETKKTDKKSEPPKKPKKK